MLSIWFIRKCVLFRYIAVNIYCFIKNLIISLTCNNLLCNKYSLLGRNNSAPRPAAANSDNIAGTSNATPGRRLTNKICKTILLQQLIFTTNLYLWSIYCVASLVFDRGHDDITHMRGTLTYLWCRIHSRRSDAPRWTSVMCPKTTQCPLALYIRPADGGSGGLDALCVKLVECGSHVGAAVICKQHKLRSF